MKKGVEIKDSSKSCQQEKEAAKFYIVSWRLQIFTHYCRYLQQNYFVILKENTANVSSISNGIHNTTANLHYIFVVESWFLQLAKSFTSWRFLQYGVKADQLEKYWCDIVGIKSILTMINSIWMMIVKM